MRIGFVSSWLERGATYVTKNYIEMLKKYNEIFVFARGGEYVDYDLECKDVKITYGYRLQGTNINWKQFKKWIKYHQLDMIIFNEQSSMECVYKTRLEFPNVLLGAYIDYYTEATIENFKYYHFLLCNTKRHFSVFEWHKGAYYLPWGCDLETFKACRKEKNEEIVFFHSMGMSPRKGTDILIKAFVDGKIYEKNAKLIIHTQSNIDHLITKEEAEKKNINIINKIVPHPGLYFMGDIYVYPTTLDGLGLTIYEALASGLPVITTDEPPMNEIISVENGNGKLISVQKYHCRKDAYYWPLSIVDEQSLIDCMNYYCENRNKINDYKKLARKYAENNLDIKTVEKNLNEIIKDIENKKDDILNEQILINKPTDMKLSEAKKILLDRYIPDFLSNIIREKREKRRYKIEK